MKTIFLPPEERFSDYIGSVVLFLSIHNLKERTKGRLYGIPKQQCRLISW